MIPSNGQPRYFPVSTSDVTNSENQGIVADSFGLRLAAIASVSPLSLDSVDGSAGHLTLPHGFTIDPRGRCFFAQRQTGDIWLFDPRGPRSGDKPFRPILRFPTPKRKPASDAPGNGAPLWSLATNSESLFIVNAFDGVLTCLAFEHWMVQEVYKFSQRVRDVATHRDTVYVLTKNKVLVRRTVTEDWQQVADLPVLDHHEYRRLIIGTNGDVYVHRWPGELYSVTAGAFCSPDHTLFPVPAVVTHTASGTASSFQYIIPPSVASCIPSPDATMAANSCVPPELATPTVTREMLECDDLESGFVIREDGQRVRLNNYQPSIQPVFLTGVVPKGDNAEKSRCRWYSPKIESPLYRCRWDKVELSVNIPAGCRVEISTATFDDDPNDPDLPDISNFRHIESNWSWGATFEPTAKHAGNACEPLDFLVRSKPGRYLLLRIDLFGDRFSTPVVREIMAKGPRQSYVDFLPAVMVEDEVSRDFLERLLSVFQAEWDPLQSTIEQMDRLFNPDSIQPGQLVRLANNFGITLPDGWDSEQKRTFLRLAPNLLMAPGDDKLGRIGGSRRGTMPQLRSAVKAIIGGITKLTEHQMRGFPWIIEGFRERNQFRVGSASTDNCVMPGDRLSPRTIVTEDNSDEVRLGDNSVLDELSAPVARTIVAEDSAGRLRLGDNSILGERKLLPIARKELDLYSAYAHRIRVVVPACWFSNRNDLCVLESMIESEKPAHVVSEISLVRPGLQIGLQSTVGVDTVIGEWPLTVLAAQPRPRIGLGQGTHLPDSKGRHPPVQVDGALGQHSI